MGLESSEQAANRKAEAPSRGYGGNGASGAFDDPQPGLHRISFADEYRWRTIGLWPPLGYNHRVSKAPIASQFAPWVCRNIPARHLDGALPGTSALSN